MSHRTRYGSVFLAALVLAGMPGPSAHIRTAASEEDSHRARSHEKSERDNGPIMMIGGRENKDGDEEILRRFVALCGGPSARIAIISAASNEPWNAERKYRAAFGRIGVPHLTFLDTPDREHVDREANLEAIRSASGVFFTGGDQHRLVARLRGTKLDRLLHERNDAGMTIAGTSAGASIMAELMPKGGDDDSPPRAGVLELGHGLDFLPGILVESHFSQRGRLGRLLASLALSPQAIGIGLDEDTALVVTKGDRAEVIGSGVVTLIDTSHLTRNQRESRRKGEAISLYGVTLHAAAEGSRFELSSLTDDKDDTMPFPAVGN